MAWWNSKKKEVEGYSYLSGGVSIEGRLCFTGVVRLDGHINGEIISTGTLVVEEEAVIKGKVLAENLILSGIILGDVQVYKHVQLNPSAKVYGQLSYGELSIDGALHEGRSHKLNPEEAAEIKQCCADILAKSTAETEYSIPTPESLPQWTKSLDKPDKLNAGTQKSAIPAKKSSTGTNLTGQHGNLPRKRLANNSQNNMTRQTPAPPAEKPSNNGQPAVFSAEKPSNNGQPAVFSAEKPNNERSSLNGQVSNATLPENKETAIHNKSEAPPNYTGEPNPAKLMDTTPKKEIPPHST